MATSTSPAPIDPRGPRFNQTVLTAGILAGLLTGWWPLIPLLGLILGLGAVFGSRAGLFLQVYARLIRPRLGPPAELEDPRPPRFAAALGTVFLGAATAAFLSGAATVGWVLALIVAALAGLAATTGVCIGCEVYVWIATRGLLSPVPVGRGGDTSFPPDLLPSGPGPFGVVFTSPFCASCPQVEKALERESIPYVSFDVTERPELARAHDVRTAPTLLLVEAGGAVIERAHGRDAVGKVRSRAHGEFRIA